jgi:4-diphosphocytidyl-2-C-methyl-D-erythritol kinase
LPEPRLGERARAKVNLDLLITGRRPDGRHELDSLVVFAPVHDRLIVQEAAGLELKVRGPFAELVPGSTANLVLRAARTLARDAGVVPRARLVLDKRLPVAAGLGGGSADAAAALRALNRLWRLGRDEAALRELAKPLGADVPVCVASRPARLRGIGERLEPVPPLPALPLLLVNPGVPVPTGDVFRRFVLGTPPTDRGPLPETLSFPVLLRWLEAGRNDLEGPAIALAPVIGEVLGQLRRLPGCLVARMSGSGATCWALFANASDLEAAAGTLAVARPVWWIATGTVGPGA